MLSHRQREEAIFHFQRYSIFLEDSSSVIHLEYLSKKKLINYNQYRFNYKDSFFSFIINPIWGGEYSFSKFKNSTHFYGGFDLSVTLSNCWTLYSNLRDNTISAPFASPDFFSNEFGGNYKTWLQNDFSEMRGGVIYNKKWGSIGLVKDHIEWGDNYNGF